MRKRAPRHELFDPPEGAAIAGIDEVGRGPLAGPVVAAAVVIDTARIPEGVTDSKLLSERKREALYQAILSVATSIGIGAASVTEIDRLNIHHATLLAMRRAYSALRIKPDFVYVDGLHVPRIDTPARAIVQGDSLIPQISVASIIAKVTRDRLMRRLGKRFPDYLWAENKGYPTPEHLAALERLGATDHHRRSFAPVRAAGERAETA